MFACFGGFCLFFIWLGFWHLFAFYLVQAASLALGTPTAAGHWCLLIEEPLARAAQAAGVKWES